MTDVVAGKNHCPILGQSPDMNDVDATEDKERNATETAEAVGKYASRQIVFQSLRLNHSAPSNLVDLRSRDVQRKAATSVLRSSHTSVPLPTRHFFDLSLRP